MKTVYVAFIDVVYWPIVQLTVSAILVRSPTRMFSSDNLITRTRRWERSLSIYRSLGVSRWKKRLPDGALWVGGSKKRVNPYSRSDALRFQSELRSAEIAHWIQLGFAPLCWFWNPLWAALTMSLYAICSNAPCIIAQRYNRALIESRIAGAGPN